MNRKVLWRFLWVYAFCLIVWLLLPAFVVVPLSFTGKQSFVFPPDSWSLRWYENLFSDPAWISAISNSIMIALAVTVISVVLGTAASLALSRRVSRLLAAGRGWLMAPLIVPVVVTGVGIYAAFLNWGLVGTLGGFILAHCVLTIPYVLVAVSASLETFDRQLEQASAGLGAGSFTTFRTVTLPLLAPGIGAGAAFAFVTSFDEVVISLFIQSPLLKTLPVQMYDSVTRDIDPTIAAASTVVIAITTTALVIGLLVTARKARKGITYV